MFDAFDSSCCSYVHKKFKKEKEEEKIFWTRVIRPSSHFNSFSKGNFWTRDIGLLGNFFLKIFCSFKDYNFFFFPFQKPSFQENTKISIRHSLFQIMMINCSTNQFVPKKDLTSFNPCGEFCQTFKIWEENVLKGNQRNPSIHSKFSNHIYLIHISKKILSHHWIIYTSIPRKIIRV